MSVILIVVILKSQNKNCFKALRCFRSFLKLQIKNQLNCVFYNIFGITHNMLSKHFVFLDIAAPHVSELLDLKK